jgi:hypothetical protein
MENEGLLALLVLLVGSTSISLPLLLPLGSQSNIDRPMAGWGWSAPSLASSGLHTGTRMYSPIARLRFQNVLRSVGADRAMSVS